MDRILVIGSLNMDLVITSPKVPVMGETVLGKGFMTCPGGKGANQAVAAARLGGRVSMIGCVGEDIFGSDLVANLIANKVDVSHVTAIKGSPTGIAMIVVKDGDNFIIVDPGANALLLPSGIAQLEEEIKTSAMVVVQLEIPLETVSKVIELSSRHGVKVLLNPAPATVLEDGLLSKTDIFTPNESECEIITGIKIDSFEAAKSAVIHLNNKGIPLVVITMGGKGVVYNHGEKVYHRSAPEVKVVDTTAAGDSFSGALAVALTQGMNLHGAIEFACNVGSVTVTRQGAQASLPSIEEVKAFMLSIGTQESARIL